MTNILNVALKQVMTNRWAGQPEVERVPVSPVVRSPDGGLVEHTVTNEAPVRQFALECLLRNLAIAERYGCLSGDNLQRMQQGEPPVPPREAAEGNRLVAGEFVSVATCPELAGFVANFEFKVRRKKESHIVRFGARGRKKIFADKFLELGVLNQECYNKFMTELPEVVPP